MCFVPIYLRLLHLIRQTCRSARHAGSVIFAACVSACMMSPLGLAKGGQRHMNPNKALWEKGDFTRIAASMRESGEAVVAGLGITPGLKVLDLGCGDGTTALPAATLGAGVVGVDIGSNLVEAGKRRGQGEGLTN